MVARIDNSRKARFKSALARLHPPMTMDDWAAKHDVGYTHLYLTLKDPTQSQTLTEKIDAFIEEVEEKTRAVPAAT